MNPLHAACLVGQLATVKCLLQYNPALIKTLDKNIREEIARQHPVISKFLLEIEIKNSRCQIMHLMLENFSLLAEHHGKIGNLSIKNKGNIEEGLDCLFDTLTEQITMLGKDGVNVEDLLDCTKKQIAMMKEGMQLLEKMEAVVNTKETSLEGPQKQQKAVILLHKQTNLFLEKIASNGLFNEEIAKKWDKMIDDAKLQQRQSLVKYIEDQQTNLRKISEEQIHEYEQKLEKQKTKLANLQQFSESINKELNSKEKRCWDIITNEANKLTLLRQREQSELLRSPASMEIPEAKNFKKFLQAHYPLKEEAINSLETLYKRWEEEIVQKLNSAIEKAGESIKQKGAISKTSGKQVKIEYIKSVIDAQSAVMIFSFGELPVADTATTFTQKIEHAKICLDIEKKLDFFKSAGNGIVCLRRR